MGRGVKADEGRVAAVQLRVYREIQADAVGVGLVVVHAGLTKHDVIGKVRQGGRRVAATELAGTAEHALGAGSLGHGAYEVFVLVAHYSAGEEGKLILLILWIGVHYVLAAGRGNKGVIRNDNTHVRVVGQHARNDGAVVAGDVHLSGAVSQIRHALGYHLAVDGVFDALSLGDDLAHVDMFCIQTF